MAFRRQNFLILDQSVTLILALCRLHGHDAAAVWIEDFVIQVIGEAYNLVDDRDAVSIHDITRRYMTKELPQRYMNLGLNRLLSRLFPYRSRFRLIPIIGVAASAIGGYETIVTVGRDALQHLKHFKP